MNSNYKKCNNIEDLGRAAKRVLPTAIYHYLAGGADDEVSLKNNTQAYDDYQLTPHQLNDVSKIDLSTELLGKKLDWPVMLSPTGMSRLFHHSAEPAAAKAAATLGTFYSTSTVSTTSLEDIADSSDGPKLFQCYIFKDRGLTREFISRCKQSGYHGLCLTVDTPLAGNRERDLVTGMTMPPSLSLKSLLSFVTHPRWSLNAVLGPGFSLANVSHKLETAAKSATSVIEFINKQFDRTVTWADAEWLAQQWDGPFVIKGLQAVEDAKRAADIGADAIMISNHGGRQLDTSPAPVDCIAPIADALGDRLQLICDGGIRRGTHVIKALALGASAVSVGRPYLYGLAVGGQAGAEYALNLLKTEIERDMALMGCSSIKQISSVYIRHRVS